MKSRIGELLQLNTGHIIFVSNELSKNNWLDEFKKNQSIKKVYSVTDDNFNYMGQVAHIDKTFSYEKFCNKIVSKLNPISKNKLKGDFEEILECGFENEHNKVLRRVFFTNDIRSFTFNNCNVVVTPYYDGICLVSLMVDEIKRNSGIGTEIINKLYDISEELNIPIYLNPYPAGKSYEPTKEKELVTKLRNWYKKIGFAPIDSENHIWNNFEN